MRIEITNNDHPEKRLWMELPIKDDPQMIKTIGKLASLMVQDQTEANLHITDVDAPVPNLKKYILTEGYENSLEKMNLLAHRVAVMGETDLRKFAGALDIESINSIDDIQRVADSLGDYELFPDVSSDRELGVYLVESGDVEIPRDMIPYIDYARVGAEYYANNSCAYGDNCLVTKKYETGPQRAVIFDLKVTSDYYQSTSKPPVRITLPAPPVKLTDIARQLGIMGGDINGCRIVERTCPKDILRDLVPETADVSSLNGLAIEIESLTDKQLYKLCAVLEAERPDTAARAMEIAFGLDDYEVVKSAAHPADYGYHVLCESNHEERDIEVVEEIKDFVDFEKYGEWRMEEDGVRQTGFGMVRRISEPFEPEERMKMGGLSQ